MPDSPAQVSPAASNGKARGHSAASAIRPKLIVAIGTAGCTQLRALLARLLSAFGSVPPHIVLLGLDTTSQPANGLPLLAPAQYLNLSSGCRQLQSVLRRSLSIPRIAAWMPASVLQAIVGDGAAASPPVARFILEQSLPMLEQRLHELLAPLRPARLADLAARANRHPSLIAQGATLDVTGPVDVMFVGSTTGGTVGVLAFATQWLMAQLANLGIDGNASLTLTLPACGSVQGVDLARMRDNCFGRLSELLDAQCGRQMTWLAGEQLAFHGDGCKYASAIVPDEPAANDLLAHHTRVGLLLYYLLAAAPGALVRQTLVDMLRQFRTPGPCGQPKFITLAGLCELHACAFPTPDKFASVQLGMAATAPGPADAAQHADDLLARHGLTPRGLAGFLPRLDPPSPTPTASERNAAVLVKAETSKRTREAARKAAEACQRFAGACQRLEEDALGTDPDSHPAEHGGGPADSGVLDQIALTDGPVAAQMAARRVVQLLHQFKTEIQAGLGCSPPAAADDAEFREQRNAVVRQFEHTAGQQVLKTALTRISQSIAAFEFALLRYDGMADALDTVHAEYALAAREYEPQRAAVHAILDRDHLARLIRLDCPACVAEVHGAALNGARREHDVGRQRETIREIVERFAAPWSVVSDFDEALRVAGAAGERAIEIALAAAEPNVRVDPLWDRDRHTARHLFVTLPDNHPFISVLQRSGRIVRCVAPQGPMSRIVIISVDMGVELAALDATREAVAAHLESSVSGFPPFADKRHEPQYDLLVPDEANWHVQLAFALFWHLQTGELQLDGDGRFTYQGIVLGQTYHEAAAALTAETGRVAGLPTLEQLDRQIRDLLHRDGQPLELLHSLEESLTEQLNDLHANASSTTPAEPKWRFALVQARSVARALARKLKARRRDVEVLLRARGKGLAEKTDDNGARLDEDNEDDQAFRRAK